MNKLIRFFNTKSKREILISLLVVLLAVISIVYANFIANKIEEQEKYQVILWAKTITEKAKILKLSNEVFLSLAEEERKKVEITSKTTQLIITENDNQVISLFLDIIRLNDQIPIVSTDENFIVADFRNIENKTIVKGSRLSKLNHSEFFNYPPIEIKYLDKKTFIFYRESLIFQKISKILKISGDQFIDEIRNNSSMLPIVLLDKNRNLLDYGNLPESIQTDSNAFNSYIEQFTNSNSLIELDIDEGSKKFLYYKSSNLASYIKWFPIGLYTILATLFFLTYSAIRSARKFEKNQIWVGMSKETAHQLGTPISSLSAWLEVFNEKDNLSDDQRSVINEMKGDVNRLSLVADRFSKIGSKPRLESLQLKQILENSFEYLKKRSSKKVVLKLEEVDPNVEVEINKQLFEWVVENLVKNAFDAILNEGEIKIKSAVQNGTVWVDVIDNGKGIATTDLDQIFEPGFTTKKRGWGLGLSLCRRIVVEYFQGKIYVLNSKLGEGTSIRVELKQV